MFQPYQKIHLALLKIDMSFDSFLHYYILISVAGWAVPLINDPYFANIYGVITATVVKGLIPTTYNK